MAVTASEPLCDLLRVKSNCSAHAKAGKLPTRGHAVNVFIIDSQDGREIGHFDAAIPSFQLFNQIEFHLSLPGIGRLLPVLFGFMFWKAVARSVARDL
jgi:hypothetical protein